MSLLSASWLDEFRASWIFMVSALSTQATSWCTRLYDDCPQETTKQRTQQKSEWKYAKHQLQSQQEHTRTTAFKAYSAFRCGLKIKEAKNRPTWFTMFTLVRNSTIYKNERYWQKWTLLTFHMKTQPVWPRSKSRPSTNGFQQPTSMRFGKTVQAWTQKRLPHVLTSLMVTCCYFNVFQRKLKVAQAMAIHSNKQIGQIQDFSPVPLRIPCTVSRMFFWLRFGSSRYINKHTCKQIDNQTTKQMKPTQAKTKQNETSQHHGESDVRVFLEGRFVAGFFQRNDVFHMWIPYVPVGTELRIAPNRIF